MAVPHDRVPVVLHRLDRRRVARTSRLHVELQLARAVRTQDRVDHAVTLRIGFQQHGSRTVAENRAGRTVRIIDDRGHFVRADDDHLLARTGLDELGARREGEEEAAASRRHVVGEGVLAAGLVGDQVARRREEHVGRHRGADHHVDIHWVHARLVQQVDDRAGSHVGGSHAFALEDMTRLDADMRHDPLVARIDHPAQFVVRQDVIGKVLPHTRNRCCYLAH